MGWNASVVLVAGRTVAQVEEALPDVFTVTDRTLDWDEASSSQLYPNAALGEIPGWVALWTSNAQLVLEEDFLGSVSREGGRAVVCLQSRVSTIHGFAVYENGSHRRTLIRENFAAAADVGDPLPTEAGLDWDDDEDTVFEFVRRATGVEVADWQVWEGVRFRFVSLGL